MNISIYCPLSLSTYFKFPNKLKNPIKRIINIKNNDNKFFLWCHIRHLNPLKIHPERIRKAEKTRLMIRIMKVLNFGKIEKKNNICINAFCYENGLVYPVHISDGKFMDLLMITNKDKLHYVYTKDFDRFLCNKTNCKSKKHFCRYCLQKILTDLCVIRQNVKVKSTFADVVCNVLVVKKFCRI